MNLFQKRKTKKRMEKLWGLCEYHIMEYEKRCSYTVPSCLPDLKKQIWQMMSFHAEEIRDWNDEEVDYEKSLIILFHTVLLIYSQVGNIICTMVCSIPCPVLQK